MNFYLLTGRHESEGTCAIPNGNHGLDHELIPQLEGTNELPFTLTLFKLIEKTGGMTKDSNLSGLKKIWFDYQANGLAWPLMSSRLKETVEVNLTGQEGIDWISAQVAGNNKCRTYYIPRFNRMLDVLDMENTTFVPGTDAIIKSCFSYEKIKIYSIFHKPLAHGLWKITPGLYVSQKMKKEIEKNSYTGMEFSKARVS